MWRSKDDERLSLRASILALVLINWAIVEAAIGMCRHLYDGLLLLVHLVGRA